MRETFKSHGLTARRGILGLGGLAVFYALALGTGVTADPNMTSTATDITTYFSNNIGVVIGVVVSIAVFVWMLRMLFHSIGVRKARSVD